METWRRLVILGMGRDDRGFATPEWNRDGIPACSDDCPYNDGKRCELTGFRTPDTCEPAVIEMVALLRKAHP